MAQGILNTQNLASVFFRWWLGELSSFVPRRLSRKFRRRGGRLEINCTETGASLVLKSNGQEQVLGDFNFGDGSTAAKKKAVAALMPKIRRGNIVTVLQLPERQALRNSIRLPLAAAENLHEALGFELDRHTPFRPEDVYYEGRITETDEASREIVVEITTVPRAVVDELLTKISAWGIRPDRVGIVETDNSTNRQPLNLLSRQDDRKGRGVARKLFLFLSLIAVGLTAYLVLLPLHQRQLVLDNLSQQANTARKTAKQAAILQADINDLLARKQFLADKNKVYLPLSIALNELSRLLPDDSWVSSIRYKDREITVSGFSKSAAALIGILESGDLFSSVKFSAPLVSDTRLKAERYTLKLKLAMEKGP